MLRRLAYMTVCATFVTFAAPAMAGPTVASFLARANPVRDQGLLAMLSPEVPQLRAEAKQAVREMKADNAARARAGKRPIYCKPEDEPDPSVEDVVDALNDIPPRQQRQLQLKDGIARVMAGYFPCR